MRNGLRIYLFPSLIFQYVKTELDPTVREERWPFSEPMRLWVCALKLHSPPYRILLYGLGRCHRRTFWGYFYLVLFQSWTVNPGSQARQGRQLIPSPI